ncbi:hypothetical protein TeGR_g4934, partial [Tetraparma gracilis]
YACEWNPDAVFALNFNLRQNNVHERCKVLQGDSRLTSRACANLVDRVSLGLLPSSEGCWAPAVLSLKHTTGGWLHVHANVAKKEKKAWSRWVAWRMLGIAERAGRAGWGAVVDKVEKVKSFAPNVDHLVADIYLGPDEGSEASAVTDRAGEPAVVEHEPDPFVPSCALSKTGAISQEWMFPLEDAEGAGGGDRRGSKTRFASAEDEVLEFALYDRPSQLRGGEVEAEQEEEEEELGIGFLG